MNTLPLVSVVIPVYNRQLLVSEAIESALNQSYSNIEVIVVDNCSTDNTVTACQKYREYSNFYLIENDSNIGPVRNWLKGIQHARGEYCWLLFSDDLIYSPNSVTLFIEALLRHQAEMAFGIVRIGSDITTSSNVFEISKQSKFLDIDDYIMRHVSDLGSVPVSPAAYIARTDIFNECLARLIADYSHDDVMINTGAGVDLLLLVESAIKSKGVLFIPETVSFFRAHGGSFSSSNKEAVFSKYDQVRIQLLKLNASSLDIICTTVKIYLSALKRKLSSFIHGILST